MFLPLIGIGLVGGVLSGLLGIGGAVLIIPALILLLKFEPRQATVTSLVALLLPVGLGALYKYYKAGHLHMAEMKFGLWIALGIFVGGILGAQLSETISQSILQKIFAALLVVVAVRLWLLASV